MLAPSRTQHPLRVAMGNGGGKKIPRWRASTDNRDWVFSLRKLTVGSYKISERTASIKLRKRSQKQCVCVGFTRISSLSSRLRSGRMQRGFLFLLFFFSSSFFFSRLRVCVRVIKMAIVAAFLFLFGASAPFLGLFAFCRTPETRSERAGERKHKKNPTREEKPG